MGDGRITSRRSRGARGCDAEIASVVGVHVSYSSFGSICHSLSHSVSVSVEWITYIYIAIQYLFNMYDLRYINIIIIIY